MQRWEACMAHCFKFQDSAYVAGRPCGILECIAWAGIEANSVVMILESKKNNDMAAAGTKW